MNNLQLGSYVILVLLALLAFGCVYKIYDLDKNFKLDGNRLPISEIHQKKCGRNQIELFNNEEDDEDEEEGNMSEDPKYCDPSSKHNYKNSEYNRTDHLGPYSIVDKLYNRRSGTELGGEMLQRKMPEHDKYNNDYYVDDVSYCSSEDSDVEEECERINNHRKATTQFNENILVNSRDDMQPYEIEMFRSDERNFQGKTARETYDKLTSSKDRVRCIKKPLYDKISNDNFYTSSGANGEYIKADTVTYNKDKVMNGAKFGDVYGDDPLSTLYPTF